MRNPDLPSGFLCVRDRRVRGPVSHVRSGRPLPWGPARNESAIRGPGRPGPANAPVGTSFLRGNPPPGSSTHAPCAAQPRGPARRATAGVAAESRAPAPGARAGGCLRGWRRPHRRRPAGADPRDRDHRAAARIRGRGHSGCDRVKPELRGVARPPRPREPRLRRADDRLRLVGQDRAGALPEGVAAGRGLRRAPAAGPGRHDHGRGPDVLDQRGLRSLRDPRGGLRERQRHQRPRRLHDHPAVGPGTPAARRDRRARFRPGPAQDPRADPELSPLQRVPGPGGQGEGDHRVPQRDLLRPRRLRDRRRRLDLLRRPRSGQADPGAGRAPRRPAAVPHRVRPVPVRQGGFEGPVGRAEGRADRRAPRSPPAQPRK